MNDLTIQTTLVDYQDECPTPAKWDTPVRIRINDHEVDIEVQGTNGEVGVKLELYHGKLRILAWDGSTLQDGPSHEIILTDDLPNLQAEIMAAFEAAKEIEDAD